MKSLPSKGRCSRFICLALTMLGACDPAGPGATGTIRVAPTVTVANFTTLEVRSYADQNPSFDVKDIPPESTSQLNVPLQGATFPFHYDVGEALGTTKQAEWRMTAWLSAAGTEVAPSRDAPQCSVPFKLDTCGAQFGDYCGATANVDCTIE